MAQSELGLGRSTMPGHGLDFKAAYAQYKQDELDAGRQPLPLDAFVKMVMMAMNEQTGGSEQSMSSGLLS